MSKRLQNFCEGNIFSAGENKDLIGAVSENALMGLFIQANTIEELITKACQENEED